MLCLSNESRLDVSDVHFDLGSDISTEEDVHGYYAYNKHEKGLAL